MPIIIIIITLIQLFHIIPRKNIYIYSLKHIVYVSTWPVQVASSCQIMCVKPSILSLGPCLGPGLGPLLLPLCLIGSTRNKYISSDIVKYVVC